LWQRLIKVQVGGLPGMPWLSWTIQTLLIPSTGMRSLKLCQNQIPGLLPYVISAYNAFIILHFPSYFMENEVWWKITLRGNLPRNHIEAEQVLLPGPSKKGGDPWDRPVAPFQTKLLWTLQNEVWWKRCLLKWHIEAGQGFGLTELQRSHSGGWN